MQKQPTSKRHTEVSEIRDLVKGDKILNEGKTVMEVARSLAVSQSRSLAVSQSRSLAVSQSRSLAVSQSRSLAVTETTWHRWTNTHGAMLATDAKKLKELEMENLKRKDMVTDQALDILMAKELAIGNFSPLNTSPAPFHCGPRV